MGIHYLLEEEKILILELLVDMEEKEVIFLEESMQMATLYHLEEEWEEVKLILEIQIKFKFIKLKKYKKEKKFQIINLCKIKII